MKTNQTLTLKTFRANGFSQLGYSVGFSLEQKWEEKGKVWTKTLLHKKL